MRTTASNGDYDSYTTLEIVNEMWERGFKFGKLDLYLVIDEFTSMETPLSHHLS